MTIASGAMANEIYKWTDENGNVHYEDRPTGAATEERLHMTYNRTDSSAVQQRIQARVDARTAREDAKTAAAEAEKEAAEQATLPPSARRNARNRARALKATCRHDACTARTKPASASTSTTSSARTHAGKLKSKSPNSAPDRIRNSSERRALPGVTMPASFEGARA